jgi:hypothetical protein
MRTECAILFKRRIKVERLNKRTDLGAISFISIGGSLVQQGVIEALERIL